MTTRPPATESEWRRFGRSLTIAWRGTVLLVRTEPNARIHAAATVIVIAAGFLLGISRGEWCVVVAAVGLVWTAEGLNTALEAVVDLASPEIHPLAGRAKDLAAGAVLLATFAAVVIGLLVFGPRVLALVWH